MENLFKNEKGYIDGGIIGVIITIIIVLVTIITIIYGKYHGFVDYKESNDRDLARITAVTQVQEGSRVYFQVDVEYLTNSPTQEGNIQKKKIEKDTFYCYYEDQELVNQLKNNLYKEVWLITGYKGGYETYKDFGTKLIKRMEIKEEQGEFENGK